VRIAIVSDIHGNLTAFEAVLADLQETSPDIVFHGGDLADGGSNPVAIVDRIRELDWFGVAGNTDEIIFRPESLEEFARESSAPRSLWAATRDMAVVTRALLGAERISWLRSLPRMHIHEPMAQVHASPESLWKAPAHDASDTDLRATYGKLAQTVVVYGHIHRPFVRRVSIARGREMIVANSGSVGLPFDGDPRASYLLIDDGEPAIRRVEYDVERELRMLSSCGLPHTDWIARTLRIASPQLP
jgi:predicted phosphodiesterase